jgi:uncharacterized protein with HEPN domain
MRRSVLVYLADITGACEAIARFLAGVDYAAYRETELTRSAVECRLIVIGEAVNALLRVESLFSGRISHARRIVAFRNQLAHDYAAVNHAVVWSIATSEVPVLGAECEAILAEKVAEGEAD